MALERPAGGRGRPSTHRPRPHARSATGSDNNNTSRSSGAGEDDAAVRSALHFAVGRICEQEEDDEIDVGGGARMSSAAVSSLTELVYQYATTSLANDLAAFSRHAGRKTVTVDDVKLVLRKDPQTLDALTEFCEREQLGTTAAAAAAAAAAREDERRRGQAVALPNKARINRRLGAVDSHEREDRWHPSIRKAEVSPRSREKGMQGE